MGNPRIALPSGRARRSLPGMSLLFHFLLAGHDPLPGNAGQPWTEAPVSLSMGSNAGLDAFRPLGKAFIEMPENSAGRTINCDGPANLVR